MSTEIAHQTLWSNALKRFWRDAMAPRMFLRSWANWLEENPEHLTPEDVEGFNALHQWFSRFVPGLIDSIQTIQEAER